ncbi:MAG: hypothetical protein WD468_03280 [Pirellulales bacterium]
MTGDATFRIDNNFNSSATNRPGRNAVVLVNGLKLGQDSSSTGTGCFFLTENPTLVGSTEATTIGINSAAKGTVIVPYLVGAASGNLTYRSLLI